MLRTLTPKARSLVFLKQRLIFLFVLLKVLLAYSVYKDFSVLYSLDLIPAKSGQEGLMLGIAFILYVLMLIAAMFLMVYGVNMDKISLMKHGVSLSHVLYMFFFVFGLGTVISIRNCTEDCNRTQLRTSFLQYENNNDLKQRIDNFQSEYHCCGVESFSDWNEFYNHSFLITDSRFYLLPSSCCEDKKLILENGTCYAEFVDNMDIHGHNQTKPGFYTDGCRLLADNIFKSSSFTFLVNFSVMILAQFIMTCMTQYYSKRVKKLQTPPPSGGHEDDDMHISFTDLLKEMDASSGRDESSTTTLREDA